MLDKSCFNINRWLNGVLDNFCNWRGFLLAYSVI